MAQATHQQTSTFFLTRPSCLQAHALSAAVGSGKTQAAIAYMARSEMRDRNFVYVAPTIQLLSQTARDLDQRLEHDNDPRRVTEVHSQAHADLRPSAEVRRLLNEPEGPEGHLLFVTTTTFLSVLASIEHPEHWHVILDEAFSPVTFGTFELGTDRAGSWDYFAEVFAIDSKDGFRVVPREGQKERVRDIAAKRWNAVGQRCAGLQELAALVANPAMRCEVVMSEAVAAIVADPALQKCPGTSVGVLHFASYVSPQFFAGFHEVLFLSALFEQTTLYHLWTKALGVTFTDHPSFPRHLLRDTHGDQGRYVAVGHLLHPEDKSSIYNLTRNATTGAPEEHEVGQRCIDKLIDIAADHFGNQRWLLQMNAGLGKGIAAFPPNAVRIPTLAHGLNSFQDVDNVVALALTNPNPQQLEWVQARTRLSAEKVTQAFRIHTLYQALGRSSIRQTIPSEAPKVFLVAGEKDARFIASLFPSSKWLGQVGRLPSLHRIAASTKGETATDKTRSVIQGYLDALHQDQIVVSTKKAKADLQYTGSETTWKRTVGMGLDGWRLKGRSLVRVLASDYGFTNLGSEPETVSP